MRLILYYATRISDVLETRLVRGHPLVGGDGSHARPLGRERLSVNRHDLCGMWRERCMDKCADSANNFFKFADLAKVWVGKCFYLVC